MAFELSYITRRRIAPSFRADILEYGPDGEFEESARESHLYRAGQPIAFPFVRSTATPDAQRTRSSMPSA
jgi:hypothetical protein